MSAGRSHSTMVVPTESPANVPVDTLKQAEAAAAHLAPKNKGGRPRIHPDRKAYKAQAERERRARLKAEKTE